MARGCAVIARLRVRLEQQGRGRIDYYQRNRRSRILDWHGGLDHRDRHSRYSHGNGREPEWIDEWHRGQLELGHRGQLELGHRG
jgi:hypothetical protein